MRTIGCPRADGDSGFVTAFCTDAKGRPNADKYRRIDDARAMGESAAADNDCGKKPTCLGWGQQGASLPLSRLILANLSSQWTICIPAKKPSSVLSGLAMWACHSHWPRGRRASGWSVSISTRTRPPASMPARAISGIPSAEIKAAVSAGRLRATTRFEEVRDVDAIVICVPTPLTAHREPDLSYIEKTTQAIAP